MSCPWKEAPIADFFPLLAGLERKRYFWVPLRLSMIKPMDQRMAPAISQPMPKAGYRYLVMCSELTIVTYKLTSQTQII